MKYVTNKEDRLVPQDTLVYRTSKMLKEYAVRRKVNESIYYMASDEI